MAHFKYSLLTLSDELVDVQDDISLSHLVTNDRRDFTRYIYFIE